MKALKNKRDYRTSDGLTASTHVRHDCQTLTLFKTQLTAAAQGTIISFIQTQIKAINLDFYRGKLVFLGTSPHQVHKPLFSMVKMDLEYKLFCQVT